MPLPVAYAPCVVRWIGYKPIRLLFQYGSNCNAERLNNPDRLNSAATNPTRAETIEEYDLAFYVWSQGNGCAASDLVPAPYS